MKHTSELQHASLQQHTNGNKTLVGELQTNGSSKTKPKNREYKIVAAMMARIHYIQLQ